MWPCPASTGVREDSKRFTERARAFDASISRSRGTACEKPDERAALVRFMIADGAAQHWVFCFNCIENRAQRCRIIKIDGYFATDARQGAEMMREDDANHIPNSKSEIRSTKQISNTK